MGYVPFFNLYWCKKQLNFIFILRHKEFITDLYILVLRLKQYTAPAQFSGIKTDGLFPSRVAHSHFD